VHDFSEGCPETPRLIACLAQCCYRRFAVPRRREFLVLSRPELADGELVLARLVCTKDNRVIELLADA